MVLLHHILVHMVHEIKGAQPSMLPYRYVDHHAHEAYLDDLNISLVHKHYVSDFGKKLLLKALLGKLLDQIFDDLLWEVSLLVKL